MDFEKIKRNKGQIKVYCNGFLVETKHFNSVSNRKYLLERFLIIYEGVKLLYFDIGHYYEIKTQRRFEQARKYAKNYRAAKKLIKLNMLPNDKAEKNMADRNETVLN